MGLKPNKEGLLCVLGWPMSFLEGRCRVRPKLGGREVHYVWWAVGPSKKIIGTDDDYMAPPFTIWTHVIKIYVAFDAIIFFSVGPWLRFGWAFALTWVACTFSCRECNYRNGCTQRGPVWTLEYWHFSKRCDFLHQNGVKFIEEPSLAISVRTITL